MMRQDDCINFADGRHMDDAACVTLWCIFCSQDEEVFLQQLTDYAMQHGLQRPQRVIVFMAIKMPVKRIYDEVQGQREAPSLGVPHTCLGALVIVMSTHTRAHRWSSWVDPTM